MPEFLEKSGASRLADKLPDEYFPLLARQPYEALPTVIHRAAQPLPGNLVTIATIPLDHFDADAISAQRHPFMICRVTRIDQKGQCEHDPLEQNEREDDPGA